MRFPLKSAVAALVATMFHTGALAADFRAPYSPPQNDDVPVELGTGWYIRGDLDFARENAPVLTADLGSLATNMLRNNIAAGGGIGYQFNNFLRMDVTGEYRKQKTTLNGDEAFPCPYSIAGVSQALNPLTPATLTPVGITALYNQCGARQGGSLSRLVGLVNAYVDLGHWWHITPYVGGGVGLSYTRGNSTVGYYNLADGSPYDVTLTPPAGFPVNWFGAPVPVGHVNWDRSLVTRRYSLAWALMAGAAYDLTPHVKLDLGYRFINLGKVPGVASVSGAPASSPNTTAHEIRLGLRYVID
jgi:opacity protein-like surface antigen